MTPGLAVAALRRLSPYAQLGLLGLGLVLVYGAALVATDALRFDVYKDEKHLIATTRDFFSGAFPPSVETLQSYPEVTTPLAFTVWGQLERFTGDGLVWGRWLNLVLSLAIVSLIALRSGRTQAERMLAVAGLLVFPYFVAMGTHLYTDVPAALWVLLAVRWHMRGKLGLSFVAFALAIATRQYAVFAPTGVALYEGWRVLQGERERVAAMVSSGLGAATLLGWFAFFGGLGPAPGLERWLPGFPAPMTRFWSFRVDYALYFLACLGAYFVIPEMALLRGRVVWRALWTRRTLLLLAGLAVAYLLFSPVFTDWPGGMLDRAVRVVFPDGPGDVPRMLVFYALACLAVVRFAQRADIGFWLVLAQFALFTKSQLAWDKYGLAAFVLLWFLAAEGVLGRGAFPGPGDGDASKSPELGQAERAHQGS